MKKNLILDTFNILLNFARFLWVLLIALSFVAVVSIFVNTDYAKTTSLTEAFIILSFNSDNANSLYLSEAMDKHPYFLTVLFIVSLVKGIVVFLIFSELIKVVQSIKTLKTFTNNNIRAFKNIGVYLLIIFALGTISLSIGKADAYRFSLSIEFYPLLGALFAFLMAEIFKEGNKLREENELTV